MAPVATDGYAALTGGAALCPFKFDRRDIRDTDIKIRIEYCGVCHSDIHQAKDEWISTFPMVPGHEIVGIVEEIGKNIKKNIKIGDVVGVGCMVGSCRNCPLCNSDMEQYCPKIALTYNGIDEDGTPTYGGYSKLIVVEERFVCTIPKIFVERASTTTHKSSDPLILAKVAPLLCAGITVYSPMHIMKDAKSPEGTQIKMGVIGLGGLGHMAVKFAKAWKQHVTVISTSENKKQEAIDKFGVDLFIHSKNENQMKSAHKSLDYLVDTVSSPKDMMAYLSLLKPGGIFITVGMPPLSYKMEISPAMLIAYGITLKGSCIGGMKLTQQMLEHCAEHNILPEIEMIQINQINQAYERVLKSDVRYRFVIDIKNSTF